MHAQAASSNQQYELPAHAKAELVVGAPFDEPKLLADIGRNCRVLPAGVAIVSRKARPADAQRPASTVVQYQLELAMGLPEDGAMREVCLQLLRRLLVHEPARRATWEEFFSCPFLL